MFVDFTTKKGKILINVERIAFAYINGRHVTIELDDGTPIDVIESLDEVCTKCQVKKSKENDKN